MFEIISPAKHKPPLCKALVVFAPSENVVQTLRTATNKAELAVSVNLVLKAMGTLFMPQLNTLSDNKVNNLMVYLAS